MRVLTLSRILLLAALLLGAAGASAARRTFDADFRVRFEPDRGAALVSLTTRNRDGRATRFDFAMPADRYSDVAGDGEVVRSGDRVVWTPPAAGGALRWRYAIDKRRRDGGYDARITDDWTIVRGDHLFPGARVRTTPDTDSRSRLYVDLPAGWSTVTTPWKRSRNREGFVVINPQTRFDRPTGWMIAGDIGKRLERHEDIEISVAAPKGDAMPRQQILAMVGWTLPEMRMAFGELPARILIVGAGDPMWRGGLSGQRSLYMHSARPLISENGTSTLLHELVHLITRIGGRDGHKYISEGLAEFYSIELLHRTGGTTDARYQRTVDMLKRWGRGVERLTGVRSRGPVTARAVILFMALDKEIRDASDGEESLDDVTRLLMAKRRVDTGDLVEAATAVLGRMPETLDTPLIR